jgi:hypothetical protein
MIEARYVAEVFPMLADVFTVLAYPCLNQGLHARGRRAVGGTTPSTVPALVVESQRDRP